MRVVIFGTGLFYERRKYLLNDKVDIVAFIDNDKKKENSFKDGVKIYTPGRLGEIRYDYVILASVVQEEMRQQLQALGISDNKILYWDEFISEISRGVITKHHVKNECTGEKVVIIVPILNYAGGFIAAYNVALVLKKNNYNVTIVAPIINRVALDEVLGNGIDVWECPSILFPKEEISWLKEFDISICNSVQTANCAKELSKYMKTIWWIHEHSAQYPQIVPIYCRDIHDEDIEKISIFTVSILAKKIFEKWFRKSPQILNLGMEDIQSNEGNENGIVRFAVIGNYSDLKNQLFLVGCLKRMDAVYKSKIELKLIGRDGGIAYRKALDAAVEGECNIELCGEFDRKEIANAYKDIDVVVCTSKEETLSMTIVEGMMCGKICLTNTNTGIAEYIKDGENSFIYEADDMDSLMDQIMYIIDHFKELQHIRHAARKTYEETFSLDALEKNLLAILKG